ncbi:hypothetical protein O181_024282 [Austropuccinia psidii MF-1]|uniref:Uncharacterized protein n=1 Tax=Austropuccinia psidii MF-1 TaxID=1389203 RepID=A0A9Q3CJ05_9BASI|nr:hypothetical protein [Austropuccinia psidii MF-1]
MIPPHLRDLEISRENHIKRPSTIRSNTDLKGSEVEAYQSHRIWQNEPSFTFQDGFQQKPSRRGLHRIRTVYLGTSNAKTISPMDNGLKGMQPRVPMERTFRNYLEYFPQRDFVKDSWQLQKVETQQEVQSPGGRRS